MITSGCLEDYSVSSVEKRLEGGKLEVKPGLGGPLYQRKQSLNQDNNRNREQRFMEGWAKTMAKCNSYFRSKCEA